MSNLNFRVKIKNSCTIVKTFFSPFKIEISRQNWKSNLNFSVSRVPNSYIFQLFEFCAKMNDFRRLEFIRQNIEFFKNLNFPAKMNIFVILLNFRGKNKQNLFLHRIRNVVGYSRFSLKGSNCPKSASIQDFGLTRIPYLLKFSKDNRIPPRQSNKNAQLTNPERKK